MNKEGLVFYADRSRVLARQRCPRAEFFEYEFPTGAEVPGIVPSRLDMDLTLGLTFHVGIGELLGGESVDEAVRIALYGEHYWAGFWPLVRSRGLVLGDSEDASFVYHEQASIAEALIRAYEKVCLPDLLARFKIVEVEQEDVSNFVDGDKMLVWGSRVDALLEEHGTRDLYLLSLKTTKEWDRRKETNASHDMQGLSEVAAVDQRLQSWQKQLDSGDVHEFIPEWFRERYATGAPPMVLGVKMEHALKGYKSEYPKGSGRYSFSTPLVHPWRYSDDLGPKRRGRGASGALENGSYAACFEFQDPLGGRHRLGKGWNRINIWEDIGVYEWIKILSEEYIQGREPGSILAESFIRPNEYYRNEEDIEAWKRRTIHNEARKTLGVDRVLRALGTPEFEILLDQEFEPHSNSCDYPKKCPYQEICYGAKSYLVNPMASGFYSPRTANHQIEVEFKRGEE